MTPAGVFRKGQREGKEWGFTLDHSSPGWKRSALGPALLPEGLLGTMLRHVHTGTRYGRAATVRRIQKYTVGPNPLRPSSQSLRVARFVLKITQRLPSDAPRWGLHTEEPAPQRRGKWSLLKCLELQEVSGTCYWCVDTFSREVEAYPTQTERASQVVQALLREITPDLRGA